MSKSSASDFPNQINVGVTDATIAPGARKAVKDTAAALLQGAGVPKFIDMDALCGLARKYPPSFTMPSGDMNRFPDVNAARRAWNSICARHCSQSSADCTSSNCDAAELKAVLSEWEDPIAKRKLRESHISYLSEQFAPVCAECTYTGDRFEYAEDHGGSAMFNFTSGWTGTFFWSFTYLGLADIPRWEEDTEYSAGDLVQMRPCNSNGYVVTARGQGCNPPFNNKYYLAQSGSGNGLGAEGRELFGQWQNIDFASYSFWPPNSYYKNDKNWIPSHVFYDDSAGTTWPTMLATWSLPPKDSPPFTGEGAYMSGYWFKNCPVGINTGMQITNAGATAWGTCGATDENTNCSEPGTQTPSDYWSPVPNPYWKEVSESWIQENLNKASLWLVRGCCSSSGSYDMEYEALGGCIGDTSPFSLLYLYNNP